MWARLESELQKLKLTTAKGRPEQKPQTRASKEMRTLSLLLAEGATVLYNSSNAEHEEFLDGR
eukprot:4913335-Amphidinium_carterae.1